MIDGEKVKLIRGEEVKEFKRHQLVSIAGGAKSEQDNWSGYFSTGLGYALIRTSKTEWTVKAGAGYQETHFYAPETGQLKLF